MGSLIRVSSITAHIAAPSTLGSLPLAQNLEEATEILGDLTCIFGAQLSLKPWSPEFDRLLEKFVRVPAHNEAVSPPRNRTDNEPSKISHRALSYQESPILRDF